jgi:putative MATE family efflux protein
MDKDPSQHTSPRRRRVAVLADWRGFMQRISLRPDTGGAPGLDEKGRLKSGRLKGLSMGAAVWILSWPILIESLLNWLVGMTDTLIAAQVGVAETDAIAIAGYVMWFISLIAMALGVGATAMVSRAVGKGRLAVANASVGQALWLGVVGGLLIGGALWVVAGPVGQTLFAVRPAELAALSASEAALAVERGQIAAIAFTDYMRIIAYGTPLASVLFIGIACTRGAGDSIKPLWVMVAVNIVNVTASILLSGVDLTKADASGVQQIWLDNPSPLQLGIRGVAWGTSIAHAVGAIAVLFVLLRGVSGVRLIGRRLRPHWHTANRVVRVAMPNFLETAGMWVGNAIVVLMVRGLSATGGSLGAHLITIRIEAISFLPGFAMSMAAATLAGQYLGAGSPASARRAIVICTSMSIAIMGLFGIMLMWIPDELTRLISSQPEHLAMTPPLLFIIGMVQIPFAISLTLRGALRGAGDTTMVMMLTWISTYLIRLPLVYAFSGVDIPLPGGGVFENLFRDEPSLTGVWIGMSIELVFRAALFSGRFFHGGWARVSV